MSVKVELNKFGKFVVQQSKSNLSKKKKRDTNGLYNSIDYDVQVGQNSFSLSFKMEDYGDFIDKGVKGVKSSAKALKSPYRFGSGKGKKGGLTNGVDGWVKRKRIQFKNKKTGRFMSYAQTSYLIRNSIWNKGLETTNFFTRPFELAFKKLPDTLVEAYGLEIEDLLNFTRQ